MDMVSHGHKTFRWRFVDEQLTGSPLNYSESANFKDIKFFTYLGFKNVTLGSISMSRATDGTLQKLCIFTYLLILVDDCNAIETDDSGCGFEAT